MRTAPLLDHRQHHHHLLLAVALAVVAGTGCAGRTAAAREGLEGGPGPPGVLASTPQPPLAQDALLLASDDFVTRARAAERLLAAGEEALDPLGRAGPLEVREQGVVVSATRPVVRAILQSLSDASLGAHVASPWPVVRREAAEEAGRRGGWSAVPALIERLEDEDPAVRAAAGQALRRLTNVFLGDAAQRDTVARRRLVDRWRAWWHVEGRARADRSPEGSGT